MYSNIVEKCFNTCVNDFTSKALSSKEVFITTFGSGALLNLAVTQDTCIMNCTEKFLKHSERVGARFAEANAGMYSNHIIRNITHNLTSQRQWKHRNEALEV